MRMKDASAMPKDQQQNDMTRTMMAHFVLSTARYGKMVAPDAARVKSGTLVMSHKPATSAISCSAIRIVWIVKRPTLTIRVRTRSIHHMTKAAHRADVL